MEQLKIEFTSDIISSYRRLSYRVWYALAEFVDNSTQAYANNKADLDEVFEAEKIGLEVYIKYHKGATLEEDYFEITDNSIGMSPDDLRAAFKIGSPPAKTDGRSRYGLGMKTASFWLGDEWTIVTKKLGDDKKCVVDLQVDSISGGSLEIDIITSDAPVVEHYTILRINKLHRRFKGRTIAKIVEFLSSIYRFDIESKELSLFWNGTKLEWTNYNTSDYIKDYEGNPYWMKFDFEVGGKKVEGWAGVLSSGGRAKGGFSLIQSKRVIQGPPSGYKPESIYGDQEGGVNNLINQRIVGELFLDGFRVSHTKDSILWQGTEEDDLNEKLEEKIGYLKKVAQDWRKKETDERAPTDLEYGVAVEHLLNEIVSGEANDVIFGNEVPSDEVIDVSNKSILEATVVGTEAMIVNVGILTIKLYVEEGMSPNDPYVIYDPVTEENVVIIIVNRKHPFWNELRGDVGVLNYLRHCVYDGVAEWKAYNQKGGISAKTVKYIKDNLMRLPFEIEKNIP